VWMVVFSSSSLALISQNHTSRKQTSNLKSSQCTVTSPPCSMMVTFKTAFSYLFHKRIKNIISISLYSCMVNSRFTQTPELTVSNQATAIVLIGGNRLLTIGMLVNTNFHINIHINMKP
jgi:hypothetical protein